jgi:8-oxo-dGTP pyrophosphatase MutT (NUDIX family)
LLPSEFTIINNLLKQLLQKELPGERAHRLMLPKGRNLYPEEGEKGIVQSSVLMLIFPENGVLSTTLIKRPSTMRNHAGQISFPGGRHEPPDEDLFRTALRESFEEIGTDEHKITKIGALTPIYVQVSNFKINPFIGWSETIPDFKIDQREVDELFIVPVEKFLADTSFQYREVTTVSGIFSVPGFYIEPLFIWGATAMIISEFREIYLSVIKS